jgi:hypothetical protein
VEGEDGACWPVEVQVSVGWVLVLAVPLGCVAPLWPHQTILSSRRPEGVQQQVPDLFTLPITKGLCNLLAARFHWLAAAMWQCTNAGLQHTPQQCSAAAGGMKGETVSA